MEDKQTNGDTNASQRGCIHLRHETNMADAKNPKPVPLCYYDGVMQKCASAKDKGGAAIKFNVELNNIYLQRLHQIEAEVPNNLELKILTYQEWVDSLLHMNDAVINSIVDLEVKIDKSVEQQKNELTKKRLEKQQLLSESNPLAEELRQTRNDIQRLLTVIRCGYHYETWSLEGLSFETINPNDIFKADNLEFIGRNAAGGQDDTSLLDDAHTLQLPHESSIRFCRVLKTDKLHVKALAWEVAEKHDEIRELKKQINNLEEEIQNAQKKIQLKDDVIKELRADLKNSGIKAPHPKNNINEQTIMLPNEANTGEIYPSTEHAANLQREVRQLIGEETYLNAMKAALMQKNQAFAKLDEMNLALEQMDQLAEKGRLELCSAGRKVSDNHSDKLLRSLCSRLRSAHDHKISTQNIIEKLELEINNLKINLDTEKAYTSRYNEILEEMAELLNKLSHSEFQLANAYNPHRTANPFVECMKAIVEDYEKREDSLQKSQEETEKRLKSLENLNQELNDRKLFYKLENESLKRQIEELRDNLCAKDHKIAELSLIINKNAISRMDAVCDGNEFRDRSCQQNAAEFHQQLNIIRSYERTINQQQKQFNDWFEDSRQQKVELVKHTRTLAELLCKVENSRLSFMQKYVKLDESYRGQGELLQNCQTQLSLLQTRYETVETEKNDLESDNKIQQAEISQLSQRVAELEGKNNSLQEQVNNSIHEITAKTYLYKEKQAELQRCETIYAKNLESALNKEKELTDKLESIWKLYKDLHIEYDKQIAKSRKQSSILKAYSQWQEEQLAADESIHKGMAHYEEHIRLLLQQKHNFLERLKRLEMDNDVMQQQISLLSKSSYSSFLSKSSSQLPGEFTISQRLDVVRRVRDRLERICDSIGVETLINTDTDLNPPASTT